MYILFAIHHSLRRWYSLFEAKAGSWKNFNFTVLEDFCLSLSWKYRFLQNVNHAKVQSKTNKYCKFHVDLTRRILSKSRFKKLGMVLKKLYRNTLSTLKFKTLVSVPKCQISPDAPGADVANCGHPTETLTAHRETQFSPLVPAQLCN